MSWSGLLHLRTRKLQAVQAELNQSSSHGAQVELMSYSYQLLITGPIESQRTRSQPPELPRKIDSEDTSLPFHPCAPWQSAVRTPSHAF